MDYKVLFNTAMLAGEIMAQSGAETYRVEDTMVRILRTAGLASVEVYATSTGIIATLSDPSIETITGVKRIANRSNNLSRINEVNQISRNICDEIITAAQALEKLEQIRSSRPYSSLIITLATVVSMGGFVGLFGGGWLDCILAGVNGILLVLIGKAADRRIGSPFIIDMAKSLVIAFITLVYARYLPGIDRGLITIGSIMPMVPGLPITNAIRDTLQGDYSSGTARAMEAFVISLGIAVGVGLGMGLFNFIF
ncbi:uncharacterized membrane protein YjjP (DUF1212 family) [Anaerotaenia torta]|uniref:threonine/serine exporter family protein n=1 Tax=Anaerotaenia torta TaxID=433293 RepID=UPI003D1959B8